MKTVLSYGNDPGFSTPATLFTQNTGTTAIVLANTADPTLRVLWDFQVTQDCLVNQMTIPIYRSAGLTGTVIFDVYAGTTNDNAAVPTGSPLTSFTVPAASVTATASPTTDTVMISNGFIASENTQYLIVANPASMVGGTVSGYWIDLSTTDGLFKTSSDSGATYSGNFDYIDMRFTIDGLI